MTEAGMMTKAKALPIVALMALWGTVAAAQCGITNTAFQAGETLSYNLYFSWNLVWKKVGTASMEISESTRDGKRAYCSSLRLATNASADRMFLMRDTLCSYVDMDVCPLYYRKGSQEGKRYTVDEVSYSYPGSGCRIRRKRLHGNGTWDTREETLSQCAYDMLSIFLRSRNLDISGWSEGKTVSFTLAEGNGTSPAQLRYGGRKTVKGDDGVKYSCHELRYLHSKGGKWKELVRFYVTDDANHIPIRLDLNLKFGSAKAYVTGIKGARSKVGCIVK